MTKTNKVMHTRYADETTYPPIRSLVPHSGSMVLLDRVIHADVESLCAEVTIHAESLFCDQDGVGAWLGIEYMAQAIAAHAGYLAKQLGKPIKIGFLLGTRKFESQISKFTIGITLHIRVKCALRGENGLAAFECAIHDCNDNDTAIATATITVFQPNNIAEFLQENSV